MSGATTRGPRRRPDGSELIFDVRTTTWFAGPCVEDLPAGCGGCVATIA